MKNAPRLFHWKVTYHMFGSWEEKRKVEGKGKGRKKEKKICVWMQIKRSIKEIECILHFYPFNL